MYRRKSCDQSSSLSPSLITSRVPCLMIALDSTGSMDGSSSSSTSYRETERDGTATASLASIKGIAAGASFTLSSRTSYLGFSGIAFPKGGGGVAGLEDFEALLN